MKLILTKQEYDFLSSNETKKLIPSIKNTRVTELKKKRKESQYIVDLDGMDIFVVTAINHLLYTQGLRDNIRNLQVYQYQTMSAGIQTDFVNDNEPFRLSDMLSDVRISKIQNKQSETLEEWTARQVNNKTVLDIMHDDELERQLKEIGPSDRPNINFDRFMHPENHRVPCPSYDYDYFERIMEKVGLTPKTCCDHLKVAKNADGVEKRYNGAAEYRPYTKRKSWTPETEIKDYKFIGGRKTNTASIWNIIVNGRYLVSLIRDKDDSKGKVKAELDNCKLFKDLMKVNKNYFLSVQEI